MTAAGSPGFAVRLSSSDLQLPELRLPLTLVGARNAFALALPGSPLPSPCPIWLSRAHPGPLPALDSRALAAQHLARPPGFPLGFLLPPPVFGRCFQLLVTSGPVFSGCLGPPTLNWVMYLLPLISFLPR